MQTRLLGKRKRPHEIKSPEDKANTKSNVINLNAYPSDILLLINRDHLPAKETVGLIMNKRLHKLFQPKVGEKEAKVAAECAINPTQENVKKVKDLLNACPALLLHAIAIKNRHGMNIKGTIYQIALHEGDDELINDVIKEGFKKLNDGENIMAAQRKTWLPEEKEKHWRYAEAKLCQNASDTIDNLFAVFKKANNPNDLTELPHTPYTITINKQEAQHALDAYREAIDKLYQRRDMIESGRDPSIPLFTRIIDLYLKNYRDFGNLHSPRNAIILQVLYGYLQSKSPMNFMQAFAQYLYYIVKWKQKLNRSIEFQDYPGQSILSLDSDHRPRVGYDCFIGALAGWGRPWSWVESEVYAGTIKLFFDQKQQHYSPALCPQPKMSSDNYYRL